MNLYEFIWYIWYIWYICIDIFHWSFHVTGWNAAIGFGPSSTTQFDQSETLGLFAAWILHHFPRFFSEHCNILHENWWWSSKFPQNHHFFWILHHNWWYLIIAGMIKFQESENDNWWNFENWINMDQLDWSSIYRKRNPRNLRLLGVFSGPTWKGVHWKAHSETEGHSVRRGFLLVWTRLTRFLDDSSEVFCQIGTLLMLAVQPSLRCICFMLFKVKGSYPLVI